jgi:Uncharacterized proteins, homologs of microcin C7 resistance protein MccF
MDRRTFVGAGLSLGLAAALPASLSAKNTSVGLLAKENKLIKPSRLQAGQTVGLIAPGWLITEANLRDSIEHLALFGLKAVHTPRILGRYGYFAGTDAERAADINEMFSRSDVDAIVCVKGGYGCVRLLDKIDYGAIRKNPKILLGFSDVTALVNTLFQETGLVCFHGPVGTTMHRDYNALQIRNVLMNPVAPYLIENADGDLQRAAQNSVCERYTITPGMATGPLAGGNLVLISSMVGTPYEVDLAGKIVCIEETGEEPYRIDRMLTQLIDSGGLNKAAGIAFGICNGCERPESGGNAPNSFTLRQVVEERLAPLGIPSAYGLSFGHNIHNFTIPIGLAARFDADAMCIELLDTAVN